MMAQLVRCFLSSDSTRGRIQYSLHSHFICRYGKRIGLTRFIKNISNICISK
jgi:hypothetical protein